MHMHGLSTALSPCRSIHGRANCASGQTANPIGIRRFVIAGEFRRPGDANGATWLARFPNGGMGGCLSRHITDLAVMTANPVIGRHEPADLRHKRLSRCHRHSACRSPGLARAAPLLPRAGDSKTGLNPEPSPEFEYRFLCISLSLYSDLWLRLCRFPKCKSAFRACAQPLERSGQRVAIRDPHPQQSFLPSSVLYVEWSWAALQ